MGNSVSFDPSTFVEGSGLWTNVDVRWVNPRFVSDWDYKGKAKAVAAFVVDLIDLSDGNAMEPQAWSVGADFSASLDGKKEAQSGPYLIGGALKKSCNFAILMESLGDAIPDNLKQKAIEYMFPQDKAQSAGAFDGLECHMIRKVVNREGLASNAKINPKTGKPYEPTGVPIIDVIMKYPWDKAKKAGGAVAGKGVAAKPAAGKAAAPAAAAAGSDLDAEAETLIVGILDVAGGGVAKDEILSEIYKLVRVPKKRNDILALVGDPESAWLGSHGAGKFSYNPDDDTVYPEE
jgi:hypothetical protein